MRGIATALLLLGAGVAQAALQPYPSQGANLVYSTGQDLTWTADANLFKTQCDAEGANNCPNLIAAIMDAGSLVTHTGTGTFPSPHAVLTTEFNQTNGQMTWFAAQAWVAYLNSISYGGATNWRLWSSGPAPGAGYNRSDSELGYLYYTEARLLRDTQITNSTQLKAVFNNLQNEFYWSGTEYATNPVNAWAFNANNGYQNGNSKAIKYYGWAVRPGQVAPQTHTIGGTVSGLDGSVVLQNNAGDDRTVSSNGPFTFATVPVLPDSGLELVTASAEPEPANGRRVRSRRRNDAPASSPSSSTAVAVLPVEQPELAAAAAPAEPDDEASEPRRRRRRSSATE